MDPFSFPPSATDQTAKPVWEPQHRQRFHSDIISGNQNSCSFPTGLPSHTATGEPVLLYADEWYVLITQTIVVAMQIKYVTDAKGWGCYGNQECLAKQAYSIQAL